MDAVDILAKVAPGVLGTVGGWVAALYRQQARIAKAEERVAELERQLEVHRVADQEVERQLRGVVERLRQDALGYASDGELERFISEAQERWESINRAVGRIEGMLEAMQPRRR